MTSLERANLDITVVSLVNSFYCLHSATLGKNPEDEDAVGVEFVSSTVKLISFFRDDGRK